MGVGTDLGPVTPVCPSAAPAPDNQMGACCSRLSNATRLAAPELRLAALRLTAPMGSTLTSTLLRGVLNTSFDGERFNWLIQATGAPTTGNGPVTIRTGYGARAADGTFAFTMGIAPAGGGSVDRWDPITVTGTMTGESFSSPAYVGAGPLTIPVFDEVDPTLLVVELPVFGLELLSAPLTEGRSCVGSRGTSTYNTMAGGTLRAFIRVEDALTRRVVVPPSIDATLCAIIAGPLDDPAYCEMPRSAWDAKPNSLCVATGCQANTTGMTNICDPMISGAGGCNAWELLGEFAAQGVDITN